MSAVLKFLAAARSLANQGLSKEAIQQFAKNEFGEINELLQRQIDNIYKPGKGITSIKKDPDFDDTVIQMQIDEFGPFNPKDPLKNLKKQTENQKYNQSLLEQKGINFLKKNLEKEKKQLEKVTELEKISRELLEDTKKGKPPKDEKAEGGRIGLKDGMSRRKFMQIMGGIAALPIVGKFFKLGKVATKAAPAAEVAKETVTQVPSYFFDLANKIKLFGKEGVPTGPRKTTTNYKNYELDEDLTTGEMRITKTNEGGISTDDGMIDGISSQEVMEYIPGEKILTKEGKSIKTPDVYEEATIRPDMDGKMKDIDDGLDNVQSIIEDAKGEAPSIKKAGGGIARMLGE